MDKALELIKAKKEQYREFRRQLGHESTTAKRLGFDTEVRKIETDRIWVMEIIDLLEEVEIKVQSFSNHSPIQSGVYAAKINTSRTE